MSRGFNMLCKRFLPLFIFTALFSAGIDAQNAQQLTKKASAIRKHLQTQPSNPDLLLELAITLQHLNHIKPDGGKRIPEAEQSYRKVLSLIHDDDMVIQILGNLAALLLEAGRAQDAVSELDKAFKLAETLGTPTAKLNGLVFNKAKALSTLGKLEEADATYLMTAHSAYKLDRNSYTKAVAAMETVPDDLLEQLQAVVAEAEHIFAASSKHSLESSRVVTADGVNPEQQQQRQQQLLPDNKSWLQGITESELSWLYFGIYKALHRRKRYDEAWAALEHGNMLMRAVQSYSEQAELHTMHTIMSVFSGDFGNVGFSSKVPIFVVGLPRSGSTLVEQIFASHSEVWGAGEDTALAPLTTEVNQVLSQFSQTKAAALVRLGVRYVDEMMARVPSGRPKPRRIVDKMLRNLWLVGYIHLLLPKSCIIHVARHPMDAGLSCYSQPFGYNGMPWAWDLREIAGQINMTWTLVRHWDKTLPGRVKTIFYEDLVMNPAAVAHELLQQCGLAWEDAVLDFHKLDRDVATASVAQVRKPLYSSAIGTWHKYRAYLQPLAEALGGTIQEYEQMLQDAFAQHGQTAPFYVADPLLDLPKLDLSAKIEL